jgi:hypothetical protein
MKLDVKADLNVLEVESDRDQLKPWDEVVLTLVHLNSHFPKNSHIPMYQRAVILHFPVYSCQAD